MIYVIQVLGGSEKKICQLCNVILPEKIYTECFYIKHERIRKKKGKREIITLPMFPGYLFIETDAIEEVKNHLWKIPALTTLIKVENEIIPLSKEDIAFLSKGGKQHVFKMNKGRITNGYVQIEEGAFEGFYGKLEKIDRHNRYGEMKINLFGRKMNLEIGLSIISIEK